MTKKKIRSVNYKTGKPEFPTSTRRCLKCRKEFESAGYSNRICVICNTDNVRISARGADG